MGLINARVFGSDIPRKVKRKLEARQLLNSGNRKPNELITSAYFQGDNKYYRLNQELNFILRRRINRIRY